LISRALLIPRNLLGDDAMVKIPLATRYAGLALPGKPRSPNPSVECARADS
jgi:hypothetical protein